MKNYFLLFYLLLSIGLFAQRKDVRDVSLDALMNDTQFSSDNPDKMELIWYIPATFWEVSMANDPSMTLEDAKGITDLMTGFEVFAVVQGDIGTFGGVTYADEEKLRNDIEVVYSGEKLQLVEKDEYSSDLNMFISIMRPMMSQMVGQLGENVHFMMFKTEKKELLPIDLVSDHELDVSIDGYAVKLDLPLNSLLIEKKCPVDAELLSGKFKFCPYHGKMLEAQ